MSVLRYYKSHSSACHPSGADSPTETVVYFILTVVGFSFWFIMAVPFACHRETYSWLATINSHDLSYAFANSMSVTYRPLSQATTWLAFLVLDPHKFPTSILRQGVLQVCVYALFLSGWWLIYRAIRQRRALAVVSFLAGGVFFSGYVHLFHIYGLMYVPVMLMVGALLGEHARGTFRKRQAWLSAIGLLLALWHPFATALFVGFYVGYYVETFNGRSKGEHLQTLAVLFVSTMLSVGLGIVFARKDAAAMSLHTRVLGVLTSYQTTEINRLASLVALLLALIVVYSMNLSRRVKVMAALIVVAVSVVFLMKGLPVLFVWISAIIVKLVRTQTWSVLLLMVAAALLPFGGGIGTPMFALFAIVVAVYGTVIGSYEFEMLVSVVKPRYVVVVTIVLISIVLMVRAGVRTPIITRAANPLLSERERTYQLESILSWLHNSDYCNYRIAFAANGGSPIDSIDNVVTRRNRPPADIDDVTKFWKTVLSCQSQHGTNEASATALITFGSPAPWGLTQVFKVDGKYAGEAAVWVPAKSGARECPTCKVGDSVQSSYLSAKMVGHRN